MTFFRLLIGLMLPVLCAYACVRAVEFRAPVLQRLERWTLAVVLGGPLTMTAAFALYNTGLIRITLPGMSAAVALTLLVGGAAYALCGRAAALPAPAPAPAGHLSAWQQGLLAAGAVWWAAKTGAMAFMLLATPAFIDDVYDNWNLRAKAYVVTGNILQDSTFVDAGIQSYPTSVPLFKAWLALLAGNLEEYALNAPHLLWYLSIPCLLYFCLRRTGSRWWSLAGVALFASMSLPLTQASTAYADLLVSAVLLSCFSCLLLAAHVRDETQRASALRLAFLCMGLLVFTKNEGLVLYLPLALAGATATVLHLRKRDALSGGALLRTLAFGATLLAVLIVPWLLWKFGNGLAFGNAKPISSMSVAWQPGVLRVIRFNVFQQANWGLVPALLCALLLVRWRRLHAWQALLSAVLLFGALALQWGAFLFTSLSVEALRQTGLARGMIHIAPVAVLLTVLLWKEEE